MSTEAFKSRFGLLAASLGMAIGAGNIWRFPRLAGQYGGAFLVPWMLFLFLWSIPLLITEFAIGKNLKKGVIGSFKVIHKGRFTWMGFFVAACTTFIMFYYSVVTGWSLKYLTIALGGQLSAAGQPEYWHEYSKSVWQPILFHLCSVAIASVILLRGIVKGIEKFSKYIIPLLFILLGIAAWYGIRLPGSEFGLNYFFSIQWNQLLNYKVWLEGLSQSAWSTGAAWGLILTYSIYASKNQPVVLTSIFTGLGNNSASILAGLAIIPTVFALSNTPQLALEGLASGNQGLAFIIIPHLFSTIPAGNFLGIIFFLALFLAALSSLISMIELAVRIIMDFGISRSRAVWIIGGLAFVAGSPSAISLTIFDNQDWVWGLGLLLSGAFFTFTVWRIGIPVFLRDWLQISKYKSLVNLIFSILFYFLIPLEFIAMISWWSIRSIQWNPENWWNPAEVFGLGTAILQWAVVILLGLILNKPINRRLESMDGR